MHTANDDLLQKVENLQWLPWIGADFLSLDTQDRILIVGESHYQSEDTPSDTKNVMDKGFTRTVVNDVAMNNHRPIFFKNFHKVLFQENEFDTLRLWNSVAFMNLVQRPMLTLNSKPKTADYVNGIKCLLKVVKILKPSTILVTSLKAADHFNKAIQDTGFMSNGIIWGEQIRNSYTKADVISDTINEIIDIIFIHHPSRNFSHKEWNAYLQRKIAKQLEFLNKRVYGIAE
jgi:hypothetical protein